MALKDKVNYSYGKGNKMNLKAFGDRVVVKRLAAGDTVTDNKIVLPNAVRAPGTIQTERGEVILVGDGKLADNHTVDMDLKPGDIIHYDAINCAKFIVPNDACQDYVVMSFRSCWLKEI